MTDKHSDVERPRYEARPDPDKPWVWRVWDVTHPAPCNHFDFITVDGKGACDDWHEDVAKRIVAALRPSEAVEPSDGLVARSRSFTEDMNYDIGMVRGIMRELADALEKANAEIAALKESHADLYEACEKGREVLDLMSVNGAKYGPIYSHALTAVHAIGPALRRARTLIEGNPNNG